MKLTLRSTEAERMDTDCAGYEDYALCLADLARVNTVTMTHRPTLAWLARETRDLESFSLLDVGCGHGDMLRRIRRWALRAGKHASLHGIDLNPWATQAARAATPVAANISFETGDVFSYRPAEPFDFIISAQFTHHLTDEQFVAFLRWMETHARRGWLINDLHRHWLPFRTFPLLALAARWHRFVRYDGRISIARGFRAKEWQLLAAAAGLGPGGFRIAWLVPSRLTLARRCRPR